MEKSINVKELRSSMSSIIQRVRQGARYTVIYRSRPVFRIVPIGPDQEGMAPLEEDPLYRAPAVDASSDGRTSADHDSILYAGKKP